MAVKDLTYNVRFYSRELRVLLNHIVDCVPNVRLQQAYGVQSPNAGPPSPSRREDPGLSTRTDDARVSNSTSNSPSRAGSSSVRSSRSKRGTSLTMIFRHPVFLLYLAHISELRSSPKVGDSNSWRGSHSNSRIDTCQSILKLTKALHTDLVKIRLAHPILICKGHTEWVVLLSSERVQDLLPNRKVHPGMRHVRMMA